MVLLLWSDCVDAQTDRFESRSTHIVKDKMECISKM